MQKKYIPAHTKKNSKTSRKKVIISTVAVVLSLCALTVGMLVAKYLNEKSSDGLVRAKNFYFTSNLLDGEEHTLAPDSTGSTSVTFTLGNHEDDLRFSEVDIEYTVTLDDGSTVKEIDKGTLPANGAVNDVEVTVSGLQEGKTYTVTAVGKGGYTKTLTATIVVPAKAAQLYYHIDNSAGEYTLLTVWNEGDKEGHVQIKYAGIPDNTNPDMAEWRTGDNNNHSVMIKPHESKVFRFFNATNVHVAGSGAKPKELY